MNNTEQQVNVLLYGDCWPVVSAVQALVTSILPDCKCKAIPGLPSLIQELTRTPQAHLVLCLRPREHVFLFYALRQELADHPTLVISDEFFFSDTVMLSIPGLLPGLTHKVLSPMIIGLKSCELHSPPSAYYPEKNALTDFLMLSPRPAVPEKILPDFHLEDCLMDHLSLLMYHALTGRGLTTLRIRLLRAIWSGHQNQEELAGLLHVPPRKIWNDKHRLLTQLNMRGSLREILYATRFCDFQQRTAFMSPTEAERLRREALAEHPGNVVHPRCYQRCKSGSSAS